MKKTTILLLLFISAISYSQNYKVVAIQSGGLTVKYDAKISITDTLFSLTQIVDGEEVEMTYDIINKRNNVTYVSDGVMTHYFTMSKKKGKKKGKPITNELFFTMDPNQTGGVMVYYLNEI